MRSVTSIVIVALLSGGLLHARELKPATAAQYDRYVALTEARMRSANASSAAPLWIDGLASGPRVEAFEQLRRGEVVMNALATRENGKAIAIDDALVHHWVGTVLIPGVSIDRVSALVKSFDRYPAVFTPLIQRAAVEQGDPDHAVVAMRTYVKKVVSIVIDGDYDTTYVRRSPTRAETTNVATALYEVHNAGSRTETREPGDAADGYLWRYRMYCTLDQRPEGSLDQCETITLTRDAPFALSWLVKPFVTAVPRDTLRFMLEQVRHALVS